MVIVVENAHRDTSSIPGKGMNPIIPYPATSKL